jgi:hypothetical protein
MPYHTQPGAADTAPSRQPQRQQAPKNLVGYQKSIVAVTSRDRLTKGYDPSSLVHPRRRRCWGGLVVCLPGTG